MAHLEWFAAVNKNAATMTAALDRMSTDTAVMSMVDLPAEDTGRRIWREKIVQLKQDASRFVGQRAVRVRHPLQWAELTTRLEKLARVSRTHRTQHLRRLRR